MFVVVPRDKVFKFNNSDVKKEFRLDVPPGIAEVSLQFLEMDDDHSEHEMESADADHSEEFDKANDNPEMRIRLNTDVVASFLAQVENRSCEDLREIVVPTLSKACAAGKLITSNQMSSTENTVKSESGINSEKKNDRDTDSKTLQKDSESSFQSKFNIDAPHILLLVSEDDMVLAVHQRTLGRALGLEGIEKVEGREETAAAFKKQKEKSGSTSISNESGESTG